MVYKTFNDIKKTSKNFLRTSLHKNIEIEQYQKKKTPLFKKVISNTLLIVASVSMLFFINFQNNINYSKNLIQPVIKKAYKKEPTLISSNWSGYIAMSSFKSPKQVVEGCYWRMESSKYSI